MNVPKTIAIRCPRQSQRTIVGFLDCEYKEQRSARCVTNLACFKRKYAGSIQRHSFEYQICASEFPPALIEASE
jgi:hypothetical protein